MAVGGRSNSSQPSPEARAIRRKAMEKLREALALLEQTRRMDGAETGKPAAAGASALLRYPAIINGRRRRLSEEELGRIRPEEFDFFMDLARGLLLTRLPGRRGKLRRIGDTSLQSEDLNTLVVLVEHANVFFGADNLAPLLPDTEYLRPNTLGKRLVRIRRAVQGGRGDGPFIRRTTQAHYTVSRTGHAYYFDGAAAPYCLILPAISAANG